MHEAANARAFPARDGEIYHPIGEDDRATTGAMRAATQPEKGKLGGPAARAPFDELIESTPSALGVRYEDGSAGGVPGVWCRPQAAPPETAILYLHGGAYVLGSARAYAHFGGQIAARANAATFVAEYRLAPEHPFPAAVDDALAAYRGLIEAGAGAIAIVGDSAGGGLALAMLSILNDAPHDADAFAPVAVAAMSPWTDLALTGRSMKERAEADPLMTEEMLAEGARRYLDGHDARDPLASPLYASLAGFPAIALHVGLDEVLLDDARRYVERARLEKVDATVHIWEGMMHVFQSNLGKVRAADESLALIGSFIAARLREAAAGRSA